MFTTVDEVSSPGPTYALHSTTDTQRGGFMSRIPSQARIIIVGGGIVGCSTAYHLTKIGHTDVVLLERKEIGCGTTWAAAGLVAQLRAEPRNDQPCQVCHSTLPRTRGRDRGAHRLCHHRRAGRLPDRGPAARMAARCGHGKRVRDRNVRDQPQGSRGHGPGNEHSRLGIRFLSSLRRANQSPRNHALLDQGRENAGRQGLRRHCCDRYQSEDMERSAGSSPKMATSPARS